MDTKISASSQINSHLYEQDFYAWTQEQAKLLRSRVWDSLDIENLAEEIESYRNILIICKKYQFN